MQFWEKFFKKHEEKLRKDIDAIIRNFQLSMFYPDYPNIIFYYQYFFEKAFKYYILNLIESKLKNQQPPYHFLELGAFMTRIAELLPEEYKSNYIISDINLDVLRLNPRDYARANLNFQTLPFKDQTFSIILGTNVFGHILGLGKIEEIKRVLKPDGRMIFIEDLAMYAPAVSLLFERLNKKSFFIYDPDLHTIKVFIFDDKQFKRVQNEIVKFLKDVDILNFIKRLREVQAPDILIQSFEEFNNFLKSQEVLNNVELSASLFSLTVAFYSFLPQITTLKELVIPFENFLTILKNQLEANCNKVINNWTDLLADEDFKKFLKEKDLKITYDFITLESNREELLKWQSQILKKTNTSVLSTTNPYWQTFLERRNEALNEFGLEIGALGEKYKIEPGIKYTALVITLETE